jgi:hypothetical protein
MEADTFKTNPLKVCIYNPLTNNVVRTYICIGDVPKNVQKNISDTLGDEKVLKDYFGPQWKTKLGAVKEINGGDDVDDAETEDIERLLQEEYKQTARTIGVSKGIDLNIKEGLEYYKDLQFYPEDKLMEVREKIYVMTGIPVYRQHVFYFKKIGRAHV